MFPSKKPKVQGEEESVSACRELTVKTGNRITEDRVRGKKGMGLGWHRCSP